MNRYLPLAWLALIPIAGTIVVASTIPIASSWIGEAGAIPHIIDFVPSALIFAAFAAVYAVFRRVTDSAVVFVLGWLHLVCAAGGSVTMSYLSFLRFQAISNNLSTASEQILIWIYAPGLFSVFANIFFCSAAIVAFYNARKRIELQTFD